MDVFNQIVLGLLFGYVIVTQILTMLIRPGHKNNMGFYILYIVFIAVILIDYLGVN